MLTAVFLVPAAAAQSQVENRGFVELRGLYYPQSATNDPTHLIGDLLAREEIEWRPLASLRVAGAADARVDTHEQVERRWRIDFDDRTWQRPAFSIRRLDATFTKSGFSVDAGKQFIRWGRTDILNPTDRFAPRDFLEVTDNDFLAVTGVRAEYERGAHTLDAVWVPRMTPSRIPLLTHRWAVVPEEAQGFVFADRGALYPERDQIGLRYSVAGSGMEGAIAAYDGINHLPLVNVRPGVEPFVLDVTRRFTGMWMVGGDAAKPFRWLTLKGEAGYFRSSDPAADNYVQYVIQAERQMGEWSLVGGYAGEVVTRDRPLTSGFAPDRGLTRTFLGRAGYTIDVNRSVAAEGAIRQNGRGGYLRGEFSQASGQHWRTTIRGTVIRGEPDDFLGQYNRNSHVSLTLRFSF
jgi:hypothetical protein